MLLAGCEAIAEFDRDKIAPVTAPPSAFAPRDGGVPDASADARVADADLPVPEEDAGGDAQIDADLADAGLDAELDASEDATVDASEDAAPEASADASEDAAEGGS